MTPAQRYAEGLRQWRGARRWKASLAYRDSLRTRGSADRFADPEGGLTYFERRQLATRRPFGARPR